MDFIDSMDDVDMGNGASLVTGPWRPCPDSSAYFDRIRAGAEPVSTMLRTYQDIRSRIGLCMWLGRGREV